MLGFRALVTGALVTGYPSTAAEEPGVGTGLPIHDIYNPFQAGRHFSKHARSIHDYRRGEVSKLEQERARLESKARQIEDDLQRQQARVFQSLANEALQAIVEVEREEARQALLVQIELLRQQVAQVERDIQLERDDEEAFMMLMGSIT